MMKEDLAKKIANMAKKTAYRSFGKSSRSGVYEIEPPIELIRRRKSDKDESDV